MYMFTVSAYFLNICGITKIEKKRKEKKSKKEKIKEKRPNTTFKIFQINATKSTEKKKSSCF